MRAFSNLAAVSGIRLMQRKSKLSTLVLAVLLSASCFFAGLCHVCTVGTVEADNALLRLGLLLFQVILL